MPTYEYECLDCGRRFEALQSIVDSSLKDCPACKTNKRVKRLISAGAGVIFKGSGFYATDYRKCNAPASKDCQHCPKNHPSHGQD